MLHFNLDDFQNLLLEKKAELINEMSVEINLSIEKGDLTDKVVEEQDKCLDLQLRQRQRNLIRNIDNALAKIASGNFGKCDSCEEELNIKRLHLDPSTNLCIECREELEETQKSYVH